MVFIDLFIIVALLMYSTTKLTSFNNTFLIMTVIHVTLLLTWFALYKNIINYFTIILLLSYIYYFGQYFLYFFKIEIDRQYTILNTFSPPIINEAAVYLEIHIVVLHMVVLVFFQGNKDHKQRCTAKPIRKAINPDAFCFVSIVLLLGSFVCEVLVLLFKIRINVTQGYTVALNTNYTGAGPFSHIINFGSTLFLPALFASLVATRGKRKLTTLACLIYIVFIVLYFLSGSRFEAVVSLAGVCLLYHFYYKRIRIKNLMIIVVVGICILYVCSLLSNIRRITNYGNTTSAIEIVQESVEDTNENNIITDVISTAGMQILSVTAVYDNCPDEIPYSYGEYYLFGILRVIPNFTGGKNIFITDSIDTMFRKYLTVTYGMGSSFIIEAYYNFGYFGIMMMVVYGALIVYVVNLMESKERQEKDLVLTYFVFYIASTSLFWIRSDARFLVREIVFYYIGIKVLTNIVQGTLFRRVKRRSIHG